MDVNEKKVGLNLKDSTLPEAWLIHEGLINLFGGGIEEGEDPETALKRELDEEIPGFVSEDLLTQAVRVHEDDQIIVFAVPADLKGHRHTRDTDQIGRLAKLCKEGDAIVRTIGFVQRASAAFFVEGVQGVVIKAYEALA